MQIQAAIVEEKSAPFVVREVELEDPRPDELRVRVVATGICATDLHVREQHYAVPLPLVLGHEGAGIVEEVGSAVRGIEVGDHVVMSFPSCGMCRFCQQGQVAYCEHSFELCFGGHRLDGSNALHPAEDHPTELHGSFFAQSSFATHAITTQSNVVKVPEDLSLEVLAPLGCGFQTGAGGVFNSLRVRPGARVAVFGTGAVGLAAIMAARVVGADQIIAVDVNPSRLDLAKELGATHAINGREEDTAARIAEITRRGADYVLETTARPEMLTLAVDSLSALGVAGLIGGAPAGTKAPIDMNALLGGRSVRGIAQGDSVPQVFIPELIDLYRSGRFPFDRLIRHYDFADINQAAQDTASGETVKAVLRVG